jgi:hypothetical protein
MQSYSPGMRRISASHPDRRVLHLLRCVAFPERVSFKLWLQIRKSSLVKLTYVRTKNDQKSSPRSSSQVMARLQHYYCVSVRVLRSPSSSHFQLTLKFSETDTRRSHLLTSGRLASPLIVPVSYRVNEHLQLRRSSPIGKRTGEMVCALLSMTVSQYERSGVFRYSLDLNIDTGSAIRTPNMH